MNIILYSRLNLREGEALLGKIQGKANINTHTHAHTQPDKEVGRGWAVLHQSSAKPAVSFYQDNRKETKVLRREKIEVHIIREIAKVIDHPKHPFAISLKCKGSKRLLLHYDQE